MWKNRWSMGALAALVAAGLGAAPARAADSLNVGEVAAALAFPYLTGAGGVADIPDGEIQLSEEIYLHSLPQIETVMTITNALSTPVVLKFVAIDGDPDGTWGTQSFECYVTGRETTQIVVREDRGMATAWLECNNPNNVAPVEAVEERKELLIGKRGILFVSLEDPGTGEKLVENAIFGDWAMLNFGGLEKDLVAYDYRLAADSDWAFGAEAIGFQACNGTNNGPDLFAFDGQEYSKFPSVVAANFVAPDEFDADASRPLFVPRTEAALILFTLDGLQGVAPPVSVEGFFFDDDEVERDYDYKFECMDIVRLSTIDPRFEDEILCDGEGADSRDPTNDCAGHLDMRATLSDVGRLSPVHGWIVQADGDEQRVRIEPTSQGEPLVECLECEATTSQSRFWARTLNQSAGNFQPLPGDTVALDLGSANPIPGSPGNPGNGDDD